MAQELIQIFVVHVYTQGAMASQFMVDCTSWGANLVYLGETSPFVVRIGDAQTGVAIGYGACIPSPNLLLTIKYLGTGTSRPCSYCQVVPHPAAIPAEVLVVDCADPPNLLAATGGDVVVNPDPTCYCDIPVEETNWGCVKALYQ
ncbi:MAG: hypothetical protein GTO51_02380 [Candidatus Latescibacteria bacterium]|nr:hypothetical protein [Candidatus Latescibacterota bacterium]NIM64821.1 hypothetical protein [Candidatus Latescibacterota bacterium]NIO78711.1 hypothetical protein [Candidatus Latescibacterota bacterium]NIT01345.1 hypothetical protein [Candidatus Latescibacterota bacterium]